MQLPYIEQDVSNQVPTVNSRQVQGLNLTPLNQENVLQSSESSHRIFILPPWDLVNTLLTWYKE